MPMSAAILCSRWASSMPSGEVTNIILSECFATCCFTASMRISVRRANCPLLGFGIDPDGEELGAEVALLRRFEVPVAAIERIGEVVVLIDKALRSIGMRVDHDGGAFDLFRRKFRRHLRGSVWR